MKELSNYDDFIFISGMKDWLQFVDYCIFAKDVGWNVNRTLNVWTDVKPMWFCCTNKVYFPRLWNFSVLKWSK